MRRFAGWAALALAVVATGCGNRNGSLVGYAPEGYSNAASLTVQVDSSGGTLAATALVFMPVPVNRVRLYDDANLQGYVPDDALAEPERTYSSGWSVFRTTLSHYDNTASHVLLARGSRDGRENLQSPLSNAAAIPAGGAIDLIALRDTIPLAPRATTVNPDAAPSVHVDSLYFHIGTVAAAQSIFLEIVKGRVTQYLTLFQRQPNNSWARVIVYENIAPALGQTYAWHVDEYDHGARLIAGTSVNGSFVITAPKVTGSPFEWPTATNHLIFQPWTIPTPFVAARPPGR
jgi:hypothetical protein